jgi:hypothetical protein
MKDSGSSEKFSLYCSELGRTLRDLGKPPRGLSPRKKACLICFTVTCFTLILLAVIGASDTAHCLAAIAGLVFGGWVSRKDENDE